MHVNRNVRIGREQTSMRLDTLFWALWDRMCEREGLSESEMLTIIDRRRLEWPGQMSRTEAVRVFVTGYYASAATEEGHRLAQHGLFSRPFLPPVSAPQPQAA